MTETQAEETTDERRSRRRKRPASKWAGVGNAAFAKVLVMGLTGVLGILTSRLIITEFGTDAYAQYGLLSSLSSLLPFADLGIAAVVINAVAQSKSVRTDHDMMRAITSAFRVLIISGFVIVAAAVVVTFAGWWPLILGEGLLPGGEWAALACLAVFGIGLPLTVGPRILVGLGRTATQISVQSIIAPFIMLAVGACVLFALPAAEFLAVFPYIAAALVAVISLVIARRAISPQLGNAVREIAHPRRTPGVKVFNLAWPMLVQMLALPIAMQTSRILVSHLGGIDDLAEYNVAAQLFGIALQTIAAAGVALWPIFARARSAGVVESPAKPVLWFLLGGLAIAGGIAVPCPWLVEFVSDGQIEVDGILIASFVVFVAFQAAKYPLGMYMTDLAGLRFQVIPTIVMIPVALGLSWWLIPPLGPAGSVIGSAAAVLLCQIVPNIWYVSRDMARRRSAAGEQTSAD
ncbi:oligosaccharide flippase family protein [Agromyces atrinae]|uniref:O-antigen/teichoic acid export membrane protein n=1 Tax=Agromyces atrinae TaxID=592376 RepID=A0A4Q2M5L4_9MICO|nr:oligosaccharide flippase family protein [Agromyces atrinae]NYD68417.1 O-antigen/teichoic acid export membrane protein [Agromyces atrinae]RXZ85161.1 polysaccharide biosynthesis protein [Agromyces atrinae]